MHTCVFAHTRFTLHLIAQAHAEGVAWRVSTSARLIVRGMNQLVHGEAHQTQSHCVDFSSSWTAMLHDILPHVCSNVQFGFSLFTHAIQIAGPCNAWLTCICMRYIPHAACCQLVALALFGTSQGAVARVGVPSSPPWNCSLFGCTCQGMADYYGVGRPSYCTYACIDHTQ